MPLSAGRSVKHVASPKLTERICTGAQDNAGLRRTERGETASWTSRLRQFSKQRRVRNG